MKLKSSYETTQLRLETLRVYTRVYTYVHTSGGSCKHETASPLPSIGARRGQTAEIGDFHNAFLCRCACSVSPACTHNSVASSLEPVLLHGGTLAKINTVPRQTGRHASVLSATADTSSSLCATKHRRLFGHSRCLLWPNACTLYERVHTFT